MCVDRDLNLFVNFVEVYVHLPLTILALLEVILSEKFASKLLVVTSNSSRKLPIT